MEAKEKLLQKLDEFGESFLDKYEVKKKKKSAKTASNLETVESNVSVIVKDNAGNNSAGDSNKKKKRRRKKKKIGKTDLDEEESNLKQKSAKNKLNAKKSKRKGPNRHIDQIKQELGLDDFKEKQEKKNLQQELKKKEKFGNQPEVVVFQSKQRKSEDKFQIKEIDAPKPKTEKEENVVRIDLDAARSEIQKFSIKGFQGEKKEEMMKNLLLKLGAKPPKGTYHNYKEYQEMKKKEKLEAKEQQEMDRLIGNVVKKKKGAKRKRDMNDVGSVDAQMGKYTPGVLHLKKDDIFRIENPKKRR